MTTPVRFPSQNLLFTPKPQRISASLASANRILRRYSIPIRLKTLSDCTPTLWVILYEAIFDIRIPEIKRQANDFATHVFNLEKILQRLEKEVLEAELPHLKPQLICSSDEDSILDLLEIFVEIVKLLDSQLLNSTKEEKNTERESSLDTTSTLSDLSFSSHLSSTQIRQILKRYIDELTETIPNDSLLESKLKALINSSSSTSGSSPPSFGHNLVSSTPISRSSQFDDTKFSSFLSDSSVTGIQSRHNSGDGFFTSSKASVVEQQMDFNEGIHEDSADEYPRPSPVSSKISSAANSQSTDSYILEEIDKLIERAKDGEKISETSKLETILEYLRQEGIDIPSSEMSSKLSLNQPDNDSVSSISELGKSLQSSRRVQPESYRSIDDNYIKVSEKGQSSTDSVSKFANGPQPAGAKLDSDEGYGTNSRAFSYAQPNRHSDTKANAKPGISSIGSHTHSPPNVAGLKYSSLESSVADGSVGYDDSRFRILMPEPYASSLKEEAFDMSSKASQELAGSDHLKDQFESLRQRYPEEKRREKKIPLRKSGERLQVQDDIEEFLAKHGDDNDNLSTAKFKQSDTAIPAQLLCTPDDSAYVKKLKERRQKMWLNMKSQEHQPKDGLYDTLAMSEGYFRKLTHRGGAESQNPSSNREMDLIKQTKKRIEQESRAATIKLNQMTKLYAKQSIRERRSRLVKLHKEKDNIDQQALSIETRIQSEESKTLNNLFLTTLKLQKSAIEESRRERQADIKQREILRKENQKALEALLKNQLTNAENEAREDRVDSGIKSQMILESLRELQKNQFVHAYEKLDTFKRQNSSNPSEFV